MAADAQYRRILDQPHCGGLWPRETHHGSFRDANSATIRILSLDLTDCQYHRSCLPQMVSLCVASGPRFFQNLPGHRMALYSDGHKSGFPGTSFDIVWLHTTSSELGLCLPAAEVLGKG